MAVAAGGTAHQLAAQGSIVGPAMDARPLAETQCRNVSSCNKLPTIYFNALASQGPSMPPMIAKRSLEKALSDESSEGKPSEASYDGLHNRQARTLSEVAASETVDNAMLQPLGACIDFDVANTPPTTLPYKTRNHLYLLPPIENTQTVYSNIMAANISERLGQRLDGVDRDLAFEIIESILSSEFPEVEAIPAIRELREQAEAERPRLTEKYPGTKSGFRASDFTLENYGELIRDGRIGPGALQMHDKTLYTSLRRELGEKMTVAEFFAEHTADGKHGTPAERRLAACVSILGGHAEKVATLFGGLRADRFPVRNASGARSR